MKSFLSMVLLGALILGGGSCPPGGSGGSNNTGGTTPPKPVSGFKVVETGGGGHCFFCAVARGLTAKGEKKADGTDEWTQQDVRDELAARLTTKFSVAERALLIDRAQQLTVDYDTQGYKILFQRLKADEANREDCQTSGLRDWLEDIVEELREREKVGMLGPVQKKRLQAYSTLLGGGFCAGIIDFLNLFYEFNDFLPVARRFLGDEVDQIVGGLLSPYRGILLIKRLQELITNTGAYKGEIFQGDDLIVSMLPKAFDITPIVFPQIAGNMSANVANIRNIVDKTRRNWYTFLWYTGGGLGGHWQQFGYVEIPEDGGRSYYAFDYSKLSTYPKAVQELLPQIRAAKQ